MKAVIKEMLDLNKPVGPLLVQNQSVDDWHQWLHSDRHELLDDLSVHGAILFRGFTIGTPVDFEGFASGLIDSWMGYRDRASKRSLVAGNVFTSTDTPRGFSIPLHNESSFTSRWPQKIFFYCQQSAEEGGRTPIADVRKVYASLDAEVLDRFKKLGVMYVRNFGAGVGMDWRDVFQVESRDELDRYCAAAAIKPIWLGQDRLRTIQVRPAVINHPHTGEDLWFNHAMALHAASLDPSLRLTLERQHGEENLPHNTYYGNGEPITDTTFEQIKNAYAEATCLFDWQPGDILLLDNLLYAHGRESYSGTRRVYTTMADPSSWDGSGYSLSLPSAQPVVSRPFEEHMQKPESASTDKQATFEDWFLAAAARELEIDIVDKTDNFVDLGGDSLSAVALLEESCQLYGREIDLDVFLSAETISEILTRMDAA